MANLLDVMRMGGNGMAAQQVAAQAVGTNIANANTKGYHRQDVRFVELGGLNGVADAQVIRSVNQLLETQVRNQQGQLGFAQQRASGLEFLVEAVGGLGPTGLNGALSDMFSAVRNLTVAPGDLSARSSLVSASQALTHRINTAAMQLSQAQQGADNAIVALLPGINANIQAIAGYNQALQGTAGQAEEAYALQDQRDAALNELAESAGANGYIEADGSMTVFIANIAVVSEIASYVLVANENTTTGLNDLSVSGTSHEAIQSQITAGQLGGQIAVRDGDLAGAISALDNFAYDFANQFNTTHKAGFDLDGNTNTNYFAAPAAVAGTAETLALSTNVLASPRSIAASASATTLPGDNTVALALSDLESSNIVTSNTQTPAAGLASLVSSSGQSLALARAQMGQTESLLTKTQSLLEAQSGVSIDEQMLLLNRIQNAHQASAKLVEATQRMLDTLQQL